jgi:transcriptional regulator with XRE-family HTH domain
MPKPVKTIRREHARHSLSYQLAETIEARGLTAYAVGKLAEVDPGVIARFLAGRRDIRLETADRLAAALGLRLVEVAARRPPRRPGTAPRPRPIGDPLDPADGPTDDDGPPAC